MLNKLQLQLSYIFRYINDGGHNLGGNILTITIKNKDNMAFNTDSNEKIIILCDGSIDIGDLIDPDRFNIVFHMSDSIATKLLLSSTYYFEISENFDIHQIKNRNGRADFVEKLNAYKLLEELEK